MKEVMGIFFGVALTPWKLIGLLGALLFAARWLVQAWATKRAGRPAIPRSFWIISLTGSAMVTAYFIWGKNDSVGILTNLLPASVAIYNLAMDIKSGGRPRWLATASRWIARRSRVGSTSGHGSHRGRE